MWEREEVLSSCLACYIHLHSLQINVCIGCEKCRKDKTCTQFNDDMNLLYPLLEEADGIILGSPTYNYTMTPLDEMLH